MQPKKKRPFLLKIIIFSLVVIAMMGWLLVYQSIYQWGYLLMFNVYPGPWYSLISGVCSGVLATLGAIATWLRLPWSSRYVQISLLVIIVGWWLDYILFTQNKTAFYNLPFRIFATLIYAGFIFGYYYLSNKKTEGSQHEE